MFFGSSSPGQNPYEQGRRNVLATFNIPQKN